MPNYTPNINLLKKDPVLDKDDKFNITEMLNNNWDKVDEAIGKKADTEKTTDLFLDSTLNNSKILTQGNFNDLITLDFDSMEFKINEEKQKNIQQTLLLLDIISRLNEKEAYDFIQKYGGLGFYEHFTNTDEVDLNNTTATFIDNVFYFEEVSKLRMKPQTFDLESKTITTKIYSKELAKFKVEKITSPTSISGSTRGHRILTGDKISINGKEVAFTSVAGGQKIVTYGNKIPISTLNVEGKNLPMFNGKRHVVVNTSSGLKLFKIDDATFDIKVIDITNEQSNVYSVSVVTLEDIEYIYIVWGNGASFKIKGYDKDYIEVQTEITFDSVTTTSEIDTAVNGNQFGIVTLSIHSDTPLSQNMRCIEYTVSTNGSILPNYTVEKIDSTNATTSGYSNVCISYQNNVLTLFVTLRSSTALMLDMFKRDKTLISLGTTWSYKEYYRSYGNLAKMTNRILIKTKGSNIGRIFGIHINTVGKLILVSSDDNGVTYNRAALGDAVSAFLSEDIVGNVIVMIDIGTGIKKVTIDDGELIPNKGKYIKRYDFANETNITNIEDLVGHYNARAYGLTKVAAGFQGSAICSMDPDVSLVDYSKDMSFEWEISRNGNPSVKEFIYTNRCAGDTVYSGFDIAIITNGTLELYYRYGGTDKIVYTLKNVCDGNFHRINVTYEASIRKFSIYINDTFIVDSIIPSTFSFTDGKELLFWSGQPTNRGSFLGIMKSFSHLLDTLAIDLPKPTSSYSEDLLQDSSYIDNIYSYGTQNIPITTGVNISTNGSKSLTYKGDHIELIATGANGTAGNIGWGAQIGISTGSKIDLTDWDYIEVDWQNTGASQGSVVSVLGIDSIKDRSYVDIIKRDYLASRFTRKTFRLDIRDVVGSHYIIVSSNSTYGNSITSVLNLFGLKLVKSKNMVNSTEVVDLVYPAFVYSNSMKESSIGGKELIGAGFDVELDSPQTIFIEDKFVVTSQYKPVNLISTNPITMVYKSHDKDSITFEGTSALAFKEVTLEITSKDSNIDRLVYSLS